MSAHHDVVVHLDVCCCDGQDAARIAADALAVIEDARVRPVTCAEQIPAQREAGAA